MEFVTALLQKGCGLQFAYVCGQPRQLKTGSLSSSESKAFFKSDLISLAFKPEEMIDI